MMRLSLTVNGRGVDAAVEPRTSLADFLRDGLDLTGTHLGCEHGVCGACTLLLDGVPVRSCITLALACGDAAVTTIEGLDADEVTAELRAAFVREHALQCGYCTPGMLISARDLVLRLEHSCEKQIRLGLSGNVCRCTGYVGIVRAVRSVIEARRERGLEAEPDGGRKYLGPAGAHAGETVAARRAADQRAAAPPQADARVPEAEAFIPSARLHQRFTLAYPPEKLFALLGDMELVASCLPGASLTGPARPDRVEGEMRVRIGPISAAFRGTARIERDAASLSGRILGGGVDARGRSTARGEITYRVSPGEAGASVVDLDVGYTLTGLLGQFSRPGLVRDVANRLAADFARNLASRLTGQAPAGAGELNAISLLFGLLLGQNSKSPRRRGSNINRWFNSLLDPRFHGDFGPRSARPGCLHLIRSIAKPVDQSGGTHQPMALGSHVASAGKKNTASSAITCMPTNGMMPR